MQIVIDIKNDDYYDIIEDALIGEFTTREVINAVKNGTPLQKGHGNLKDMGNLKYIFDLTKEEHIYSEKDIERAIR